MNKIARPKSVLVAGVDVVITYPTNLDNPDEVGESNSTARTIKVRADQKGDEFERTLLHEIIHSALGLSGVGELLDERMEEAIVVCLENSLHMLYERRQ